MINLRIVRLLLLYKDKPLITQGGHTGSLVLADERSRLARERQGFDTSKVSTVGSSGQGKVTCEAHQP